MVIIRTYEITKEQEKALQEKMEAVLDYCRMAEIPVFLSAAVSNDERGTEYLNMFYGAKTNSISLTDDQIRNHILVADGFSAVPPREKSSFFMPGPDEIGFIAGENREEK